ncbi:MAG TPA: hypothetical protein VKS21_11915, partial [Spirochaetota bacterium]|nr:hypothetical protein [Spirochaetota bacterium]
NIKINDGIFRLSYGRFLTAGLSMGINIKFLTGKKNEVVHQSLAFDSGLQGIWLERKLKAGLAFRNGGVSLKPAAAAGFNLPMEIRAGLSYRLWDNGIYSITGAAAGQFPLASDSSFGGGIELTYKNLQLRLGDYYNGTDNAFTCGLGIDMDITKSKPQSGIERFTIDFSFNSGNILGPIFQTGLTLAFASKIDGKTDRHNEADNKKKN